MQNKQKKRPIYYLEETYIFNRRFRLKVKGKKRYTVLTLIQRKWE